MSRRRPAALAGGAALVIAVCVSACAAGRPDPDGGTVASGGTIPSSVVQGMRPIGKGKRFLPPVTGSPTGGCASAPGPDEAHLELFGANRVVLIAAGVGHRGRCWGNAVTTDPTGVIHYRPGATLTDVFRAWGEPLSADRMASFSGPVRYYLAGRRVAHAPSLLSQHEQLVIEVGPYVPPHASFSFPKGL